MTHKNSKYKTFDNSQFVLLSFEGEILASDNALLKLQPLKGTSIQEHIPFVESVFPNVISKIKTESDIHFSAINLTDPSILVDASKNFFDFNFFRRTKEIIVWEILDLTEYYKKIRDELHYYQERELRLQYLEQNVGR